jgi:nitroimidazol reductase NimA-like FMN-containing flavoprotein (pyridoxamine 5'-phosphate oxidase superfamily)
MEEPGGLERLLADLFAKQKLAVLATLSGGQPYSCLVAFAETEDLKGLVFTTFRSTRKYRDIMSEPRVALLVDNRSNEESDFSDALAVTATGRAEEVMGGERERLLSVYLAKHPHLAEFAGSSDSALVRVGVENYVVSSFHEVAALSPE